MNAGKTGRDMIIEEESKIKKKICNSQFLRSEYWMGRGINEFNVYDKKIKIYIYIKITLIILIYVMLYIFFFFGR